MRITNFLFSLHKFFETQEYRFFFHRKFTKCFSLGKIGKLPVYNLQFK
jgi:hypothetical protein